MSVFFIPYALGNLVSFTFKEISCSNYMKYSQAASALFRIGQEKYLDNANVDLELSRLTTELEKKT